MEGRTRGRGQKDETREKDHKNKQKANESVEEKEQMVHEYE